MITAAAAPTAEPSWSSSANAPRPSSRVAAVSAVRRPAAGSHGLQVALDRVRHRLDHVVVDPGRDVVDAGGDREQSAVLDALHGQPGVAGEMAAVLGEHPVAAVDGGGVEKADAAGELGHQLGDRHRAGQHQVHPARSRGNRDPDQPRGTG